MSDQTSIIIPLAANGFGSRQNDTELRFALRSIEKHLSGYGDIFLIGHKPKWVNNVIHIPAEDEQRTWWKERNIYRKILLACEDPRVSDDFLFMNDDHYLLASYEDAWEMPYYFDEFMVQSSGRDDQYGNSIKNTIRYLDEFFAEDNPLHWDVHCPILYNKERFSIAFRDVDWGKKYGYCIKSIYCDRYRFQGEQYPDLKINQPLPPAKIKELLTGRSWFSVGNKAFDIGGGMVNVLQELYSKPSKYE